MQFVADAVSYRFNFLKYRYLWLGLSVSYLFIGAVAYVMLGGFRYHVDFAGGAELQVAFEHPLDIGAVRSFMGGYGLNDAVIQNVGNDGRKFVVRIATLKEDEQAKLSSAFATAFQNNKASIENIQWVGPEVGKDTTRNAMLAVFLSMIILLLYIAARFEFRFGVGAVLSLLHDVVAVMVFLLITGEPLSLNILAAILAVLGYSLNDTIVIFSKIRENMHKLKGVSECDVANLSINQTLTRTMLTSLTTLLAVLSLYILGGPALHGFSFVMLLGIVFGTYSSIYIASPIMLAIAPLKRAQKS